MSFRNSQGNHSMVLEQKYCILEVTEPTNKTALRRDKYKNILVNVLVEDCILFLVTNWDRVREPTKLPTNECLLDSRNLA